MFHKTNGGLSDARNYGLRRASGEYILFIDSDDYIDKSSISIILAKLKMLNDPDIMFLECYKYYENSGNK